MADLRENAGKYLFAAFITLVFLALVYYLLQEIPAAQHPTLHQVTTVPASPTSS